MRRVIVIRALESQSQRQMPCAMPSSHAPWLARCLRIGYYAAMPRTMPAFLIKRAQLLPILLWLAILFTGIGDARTRAGAAYRAGAPPPNVLLARARSEPAIALDPGDSQRLVAAANPDYYRLLPHEPLNGTFASADGGATWVRGSAPTYGNFTGVADPSLGEDAAGHVYYLYMGETPSFCGEGSNVALLLAR